MVEIFQNLWNAIKSGDMQAILSCIALVSVTFAPFLKNMVTFKLGQWKEKFLQKKEESERNLQVAISISDQSKKMMASMKAFIETSLDATSELANWMAYITEHSTLTDEQKAYAKKNFIDKMQTVPDLVLGLNEEDKTALPTEGENKKDEEVPTQTLTNESQKADGNAPLGL